MRKWIVAALAVGFTGGGAQADEVARQLGYVLASEAPCGMVFDQAAIERYIEDNVDAADMGFARRLTTSSTAMTLYLEDYTASQKTAHCAQMRRVAKTYGFID
ncbi:hypothetical protein [Aquibium oceanicum]|uniref:Signal recognition particle n=1 Tax=Aquibium oceanicum TaxID=1670800 RepID=A0A1L3SPR0_9HYPH|nr:hypothetical protein [Aquibium oceanicum]APH71417.1 hypothetical protein BSQ44_08590 [Aquibium oceanicum]